MSEACFSFREEGRRHRLPWRRASGAKWGVMERVQTSQRWGNCEAGHGRAQPIARVHSGHCQDDKQQ
jgi:hypothetical protein